MYKKLHVSLACMFYSYSYSLFFILKFLVSFSTFKKKTQTSVFFLINFALPCVMQYCHSVVILVINGIILHFINVAILSLFVLYAKGYIFCTLWFQKITPRQQDSHFKWAFDMKEPHPNIWDKRNILTQKEDRHLCEVFMIEG